MPRDTYGREALLQALEEIGSDGGDLDLTALGIDFGGDPSANGEPEGDGAGEPEAAPREDES